MDLRAQTLRAGELSHRVTIHAPAETLHATATDVATGVPMRITALDTSQQREYLALGGLQAGAVYRVSCRYRTDIRMPYVLREECCQQRQMQILSQVPTDRNEGLELICVVAVT